VHLPFVWRTRVLLWMAVGVVAVVAAWWYGNAMDVEPTRLIGLREMQGRLVYAIALVIVVALFVVFDVVRRTRPVARLSQIFQVWLLLSLSLFAVLLPPVVFVSALAPRVAGLESEAAIAVHAENGFWNLMPPSLRGRGFLEYTDMMTMDMYKKEVTREIDRNADTVVSAIRKFIQPDFLASHDDPIGVDGIASFLSTPSTHDNIANFVTLFDRLQHVHAAQRYRYGDGSGYKFLTLNVICLTSVFVALLGSMLMSTSMANIGDLPRRLPPRGFVRLDFIRNLAIDSYLAKQCPAIWSSRVHGVALLALMVGLAMGVVVNSWGLVLTRFGSDSGDVTVSLLGIVGLLIIGNLTLVYGTQTAARFAPLPSWRGEFGVFVIQFAAIFLELSIAAWVCLSVFGEFVGEYRIARVLEIALMVSMMAAVAMQVSRAASIAVFLGCGAIILGTNIAISSAPTTAHIIWNFLTLASAVALAIPANHLNIGSKSRRFAVCLCIATVPLWLSFICLDMVPAVYIPLWFDETPLFYESPLSLAFDLRYALSTLVAMVAVALVLRLTHETRRALAYTK
jgi:hypothetical protein